MKGKNNRIKELELMLFDSDLHLEAAIEEINRLKAILKDVKLTAEWHIEDCACSHPMSKYQLGWFEAMNLIKENPFSGDDDNYDCQWASKFMRKSYEAGKRSQQEKIDNLLSYVENGGHTPNWIIREFLK